MRCADQVSESVQPVATKHMKENGSLRRQATAAAAAAIAAVAVDVAIAAAVAAAAAAAAATEIVPLAEIILPNPIGSSSSSNAL